ncbi:MAG: glycosyltransferase family 2 protein [bacterium JZ-2024 1]
MGSISEITAAIITHNPESAKLSALLDSLSRQTIPVPVVIFDNGSERPEAIRDIAGKAAVERFRHNLGFATATNRACLMLDSPFSLILNDDVVLAENAVEEMKRVLLQHPDAAAVAPKTYLSHFPGFLDNVGIVINEDFSAYNRGIGEPDLGQYDKEEKIFGVCFACTLLRREVFLQTGMLPEIFFAYYEDVDWCFRAQMYGFSFYSAPSAQVVHHHSWFWRQHPERKYLLVQKNLLRCAVYNLRPRSLLRVLFRKYREHFRRFLVEKEYRIPTLFILFPHWWEIPFLIPERVRRQRRRVVPDHPLFRYSYGTRPHFHPTEYRPLFTVDNLRQTYQKLSELTLQEHHLYLTSALEALSRRSPVLPVSTVKEILKKLLFDQPPIIQDFLEHLEPEKEV